MKEFLRRLYTALTAPLYRRLLRDLTIQVQDAHATTLDFHENITARLLDELVCVRLEMARALEKLEEAKALEPNNYSVSLNRKSATKRSTSELVLEKISDKISDDEIHRIVNEISSHMRIVELACDTQVPMSEILDWRSKYTGLTVNGVRKMRRIEQENEYLKQELARMQLELTVASESTISG